MPEGSSSAAPVTRPGPSDRSAAPMEVLRSARFVLAIGRLDAKGGSHGDLKPCDQISSQGKVPASGTCCADDRCFSALKTSADVIRRLGPKRCGTKRPAPGGRGPFALMSRLMSQASLRTYGLG